MDNKVLVAHAGKHGATAEIAEHIGAVVRAAGLTVEVAPARRVCNLVGFGAVVLGSAVYMGRWRREAANFLQAHERTLAGMPVWLFSSGPTGPGDVASLLKGWSFPLGLKPIADRIGPRGITAFHGKLDLQQMNAFERWIIKRVKAPVGDFRDWPAIDDWARAIAEELRG